VYRGEQRAGVSSTGPSSRWLTAQLGTPVHRAVTEQHHVVESGDHRVVWVTPSAWW